MVKRTVAPIRWLTVLGIIGAAAIGAVAFTLSRDAGAENSPFTSRPAVGNITALNDQPSFVVPPGVVQNGGALGEVRPLGPGAYVWKTKNEGVCLLMASGSGGCFSRFDKPVILFLSGDLDASGEPIAANAEGVVADGVNAVAVVLSNGNTIDAPITRNSFDVSVPPGQGIRGLNVSLSNGTTFFSEDELAGSPPKRPKAG